jgi:hypothetical protein
MALCFGSVDEADDVTRFRRDHAFFSSHSGGQLGYGRLYIGATGFGAAKSLCDLESVLLSGDCVWSDEAYPEVADVNCAMLGEDLFHCVLNCYGERLEGDCLRSH